VGVPAVRKEAVEGGLALRVFILDECQQAGERKAAASKNFLSQSGHSG
jgi:hypothetical protein